MERLRREIVRFHAAKINLFDYRFFSFFTFTPIFDFEPKISHKKSDLSFPKDRSFSRLKVQFLYEFYFDFIPYGNCAFELPFFDILSIVLSDKL